MTPAERTELTRLLSALCDDALDGPGRARLEDLLAADPECRRVYLEYADLHARLLAGAAAPAPVAAPAPAPRRPAAGRRQLWRYAQVAAGTLAFTLLIQFAVFGFFRKAAPVPPGGDGPAAPAAYVATLVQSAGGVWDGRGPAVGARVAAGEVRLRAGTARLRFDGGPTLTLEAPVRLRLETPTAATLLAGKVVFRDDGPNTAFDLRTPQSTLVDFGTEYAVAVGPDREEVHVFDGEVRRTPQGDPAARPEVLAAGDAREYAGGEQGRPTPCAPERFVRRVPTRPADPAAELLAYEGFHYPDREALARGVANDGVGWTTPWASGFARPLNPGDTNRHPLNPAGGLTRPGAGPTGGCFEYAGFTRYVRRLPVPVRTDTDAVYYLSYLFRRDGPPADPLNAVAVMLRTAEDLENELAGRGQDPAARFNAGLDQTNSLFTFLRRVGARTPLPLTDGVTYLLVAKIAAAADAPDQVFVRVYGPTEPVDGEEPGTWSLAGPPVDSDLAFDWLQVHINSRTRQAIDEVRVGTTWASVAAAWRPQK